MSPQRFLKRRSNSLDYKDIRDLAVFGIWNIIFVHLNELSLANVSFFLHYSYLLFAASTLSWNDRRPYKFRRGSGNFVSCAMKKYVWVYIYYPIFALCLHYVYIISTTCLHIKTNMIYTWYMRKVFTYIYIYTWCMHSIHILSDYYIQVICTLWQSVVDALTHFHHWLQCFSAAVPWRAACFNIVCVGDSNLFWWTVCNYFFFCMSIPLISN